MLLMLFNAAPAPGVVVSALAQTMLASHRRSINAIGEQVIVRRYSGVGGLRTPVDTITQARVVGYTPAQLVGPIVQGDRQLIMLVDTLAAMLPLTTSDTVVIRGREVAIKSVDDNTKRIGAVLIALMIHAAG